MAGRLEKDLERWLEAGIVDHATAGRIAAFESARDRSRGLHGPVLLGPKCRGPEGNP